MGLGGFLRNSHKYGLESLRKTPTEDTPPIGPDPKSGQMAFNQPTNQPANLQSESNGNRKIFYFLSKIINTL